MLTGSESWKRRETGSRGWGVLGVPEGGSGVGDFRKGLGGSEVKAGVEVAFLCVFPTWPFFKLKRQTERDTHIYIYKIFASLFLYVSYVHETEFALLKNYEVPLRKW